jgi:hypothetical protein
VLDFPRIALIRSALLLNKEDVMSVVIVVVGIELVGAIFLGYGFLAPERELSRFIFFAIGIIWMAAPLGAILEVVLDIRGILRDIRVEQLKTLGLKEKS